MVTFQNNALHIAVSNNNVSMCQSLIKHNPDLINAQDIFGVTPKHTAFFCGFPDIVKILCDLGATHTPLQHVVDTVNN